ncbi:MAG: bifunctional precorrin-2 dehydrogenase/sirohydrochlorin ferrochelatase [Lachnospiraceae bacterium]
MAKRFPVFLDLTDREIHVYGAGRIAARRVETLLAFSPRLTVHAPEASGRIHEAASQGKLLLREEMYEPGTIPADTFMVLAATNDAGVNERICAECREKKIPVNVCSDRELCDFHFPGIASKGELVIGVHAGGAAHSLAKKWTDRIRREVEEDGYDNQAEEASDDGKAQKDGAGDADG